MRTLRLTIELTGITNGDVELFEKMNSSDLSIRVQRTEGYANVSAYGSYDAIIPVIMQATAFKSYSIQLH